MIMTDADDMYAQLRAELDGETMAPDIVDDAEDDDDVWPFHLLGGAEFAGPFATYDEGGRPLLNIYGAKRQKGEGGRLRWVPDAALSEFIAHDATRKDVLELFGPGRYALRLLNSQGHIMSNGSVSVGDLRRRAPGHRPAQAGPVGDERVAWLQQQLEQVRSQAAEDVKRARLEAGAAVQRTHEEYKSRLRRLDDELKDAQADKRKLREALNDATKQASELSEKVRQLEFDKLKLEMQAANGGQSADPVEAMKQFHEQRRRYEEAAAAAGLVQPQAPRRSIGDAMQEKVNEVMSMGKKAGQLGVLAAMGTGN